ncbi:MAG TPA: hypothetical protein VHP37_20060 [Burkholderiales bacterium]|nr:hypothetical protein [Burkholderiales bacterium]
MGSRSYAESLGLRIGSGMPGVRFVPIAFLVVLASAAAGHPGALWAAMAALVALLLLLQFRLWDDLADVAGDRGGHAAAFRAAAWVAFTATFALLAVLSGAGAVAAFLALCAFYGAWYTQPPQARAGLVGAHIVVLKYPAFVLLLAPRPLDGTRTALSCAAIYFACLAYELIHDAAHRSRRGAPALAAAALVAVGCTVGALAVIVLREALA